MILNIVVLIS